MKLSKWKTSVKKQYVGGMELGYRDWETRLTIVTGKQIGRAHV